MFALLFTKLNLKIFNIRLNWQLTLYIAVFFFFCLSKSRNRTR